MIFMELDPANYCNIDLLLYPDPKPLFTPSYVQLLQLLLYSSNSKVHYLQCEDDISVLAKQYLLNMDKHRRRIKTEEKAKVVAAVWGTEVNQFFAAR